MTAKPKRFTEQAAGDFRAAIAEADGVEVFAIGTVEGGAVVAVEVAARGTKDQVLAILGRPRQGQVVMHNHPSGLLEPSPPDLQLAHRYAEDGVGFVIVDNAVSRANFVVEPWTPHRQKIAHEDVDRFFTEALPQAIPGWEVRDAQRQMAARVVDTLNEGTPLVVEAGTGTGKSLAYLVPAAMWALANDSKVMIATHTRALQAQLLSSDLPLLAKGGLEVRTAVLEGRGNYVCKRRLRLARDETDDLDPEHAKILQALVNWDETSDSGSRTQLGFRVPSPVWERVESASDLTLSIRCPHYDDCHYYKARKAAAGAHVVVVNHALLLADLVVRRDAGFGVLPDYKRVILDEAHHLEDVATGAGTSKVSREAVTRALGPLLPRKKKPGALARLGRATDSAKLPDEVKHTVSDAVKVAALKLEPLSALTTQVLGQLATVLDPSEPTARIDDRYEQRPEWSDLIEPNVAHLAKQLEIGLDALTDVLDGFGDHKLPQDKAQPLLEVRRGRSRLERHAIALRRFLEVADHDVECRWIGLDGRRDASSAAVHAAPIDIAPVLKALLWDELPGTVCTSATLSVGGSFDYWRRRHGLKTSSELELDSPFDHHSQAILGLPTDLPEPNHPDFLRASARRIVEAIGVSQGGAFVLCTSYKAVDAYAAALRAALPAGTAVLAQGSTGRAELLRRFKARPNAVLVGTDSFWEGVSVKGQGLRLVVLPRLPFRVPSDPLQAARQERMVRRGLDPFKAYTLPQAVLKLRQGYGRLLRSPLDRGAVLLLDTRIHSKSYGRRVLAALPPARRVKGPWHHVQSALRELYATAPPLPPASAEPLPPELQAQGRGTWSELATPSAPPPRRPTPPPASLPDLGDDPMGADDLPPPPDWG